MKQSARRQLAIPVNGKVLGLFSALGVWQQQFEQGASIDAFTRAVDNQQEYFGAAALTGEPKKQFLSAEFSCGNCCALHLQFGCCYLNKWGYSSKMLSNYLNTPIESSSQSRCQSNFG